MKTTKTIFFVLLLSLFGLNSHSQNNITDNDTNVYLVIDKYPVLIADNYTYEIDKVQDFIKQHLKYPDNGPDCIGCVFITITIEKNGTVSKKEYLRKLCSGYDENAMDVVDKMTNWKPANKNGKPVRYKLTLPIKWI
jgi:hypothetical protein